MAVEKKMEPSDIEVEGGENIEIEVVNPEAVSVETEDGGMLIDFSGEIANEILGPSHDANLAEFLDEADLQSMASELVGDFDGDRMSRKEWARSYVK